MPSTTGPRIANSGLRPSERLLIAYFSYVFARTLRVAPLRDWGVSAAFGATALAGVLLPAGAERRLDSRFWSLVRDWVPAPLLLVAYWSADSHATLFRDGHLERSWIRLDRLLLEGWGVKHAIEWFGAGLPFLLELCYSLLYALPPVCVGILYLYRRRDGVDRFFFTLLLGALTTYALLPWFPTLAPRHAFPGEDLPAYLTLFRRLNLFLLDHADIGISVFPSGHVTVGFSAAFGMLLAMPERKSIGLGLAALAAAVTVVTMYGRYHYAVDGLAGIAISLLAWAVSAALYPSPPHGGQV